MSFHRNAKLGLAGRYALVCAIESGSTLKAAAAAFSVSPATAHRWWHRVAEVGRLRNEGERDNSAGERSDEDRRPAHRLRRNGRGYGAFGQRRSRLGRLRRRCRLSLDIVRHTASKLERVTTRIAILLAETSGFQCFRR